MPDEPSIVSVEQIGGETVLIKFRDETSVLLTLEEILGLGLPRYPLSEKGRFLRESLDEAVRSEKI